LKIEENNGENRSRTNKNLNNQSLLRNVDSHQLTKTSSKSELPELRASKYGIQQQNRLQNNQSINVGRISSIPKHHQTFINSETSSRTHLA